MINKNDLRKAISSIAISNAKRNTIYKAFSNLNPITKEEFDSVKSDISKVVESMLTKDTVGKANGVASLDSNGSVPIEQLSNIDTTLFLIVRELPTTDIKTNKIYLVPNKDAQGNNIYVEYLYVENVWENLGEFKSEVDLSEYINKLSTEIIYDVSARNNGVVFESLSAILSSSNLSTLIPTSVRHGGMNIRFIQGSEQSSDNKYVQYRLMANTFSTTVTDWQGVDDEPTTGSNNLVKSGGIADYINKLKNAGYLYAGIATPTTNPGTPDGHVFYIATTSGSYSNFNNIEVLKGETAILKWNNSTWTKNAIKPMTDFNSVFDANGRSLVTVLEEQSKTQEEINKEYVEKLSELESEIYEVKPLDNYLNPEKWVNGTYIKADGSLSTNSVFLGYYSDFIDVNVGDVVRLYGWYNDSYARIPIRFVAAYGENEDAAIPSLGSSTQNNSYTVPEGVRRIKLTGAFALNPQLITVNKEIVYPYLNVYIEYKKSNKESIIKSLKDTLTHTNDRVSELEKGKADKDDIKDFDNIIPSIKSVIDTYESHTFLYDRLTKEGDTNIKDYVATGSSDNAVVEVTDGVLKITGTIKPNYNQFNIGFNISPTLYAEKERKFVILLTGKVRSNNLRLITLCNATNTASSMVGQDYEENANIAFQSIMIVDYAQGQNDNGKYIYFKHNAKDSSANIEVDYTIDRYCVFDYIDGWSIDDYKKCIDERIVLEMKSLPKNAASKEYVSEEIKKVKVEMSEGANATPYSAKYGWDINMIINYGQSLSVGAGAALAIDNFRNALAFPGGINEANGVTGIDIDNASTVKSWYGDRLVSVKDMKLKNFPPIASAAIAWMSLLEVENNIDLNTFDYQFLLSTPGFSGIDIEGLSKAGRYPDYTQPSALSGKRNGYIYDRLMLSVNKGMENAIKEGKTFGVSVIFYVQGEANAGNGTDLFYNKQKQLFEDLNNDIKIVTGQEEDIVFLPYQMASYEYGYIYQPSLFPSGYLKSGPTYAAVKLAKDMPNVYIGGAMYQYDYGNDKYHPVDRAIVGLQAGIIAKRIVNDGVDWKAFMPTRHTVQNIGDSHILSVEFDVPCPPMRFVTNIHDGLHNVNGKQTNYGFTLVKNEVDIIAEEPVIKRGNTIVFKCTEDPTGAMLNYARSGHYGGGNLCDSQNIKIKCKNKEYTIDNFCLTFADYEIVK